MASICVVPHLDGYKVDRNNPFAKLESLEQETAIIRDVLDYLKYREIVSHTDYDPNKLGLMRNFVQSKFDIPWTSVSLRAQHLIYALNCIHQPKVMIAAGIFCGSTFINNAGSAVGPGACYAADELIGIEIVPAEAARAARNVSLIDSTGKAKVVCDDAVTFCRHYQGQINLLYLDAVVMGGKKTNLNDATAVYLKTKSLYFDILEACYDKIPQGGLILAHNSVDYSEELTDFLSFVRSRTSFRNSVNVVLDTQGLEVTVK
jgi:predicted O-methyltransferase YrrM